MMLPLEVFLGFLDVFCLLLFRLLLDVQNDEPLPTRLRLTACDVTVQIYGVRINVTDAFLVFARLLIWTCNLL